jgi:phage terminase small subunit
MAKLTVKQQAFVANKVAGVVNRDAAIAAGYAVAGASVAADKLMHNPAIRAAIKAATKGEGVTMPADKPTMPRKHYADAKEFLVDVMNHHLLPIAMRADAAKQLLPYQHARMGEQGKKEKAKERARELTGKRGLFTPKQPPTMRIITGGKDKALE